MGRIFGAAMPTPPAACLPLLLVAVLGGGCETAREMRIREHRDLFQSLDPFSQKLVHEGLFNIGFTADSVVMALGKPDRVEPHNSAEGPGEIWTYKNFLYSSINHMTIGVRDPTTTATTQRAGTRGSPGMSATPPATPTVAEMSGPPLATLRIELREGRVTRATIDP
jgi:hypothetical protein